VKVLLDENIPAPVTSTVKMLLRRSHDVQHVIDMPGWSGTKDLHLYGKAKAAGFEVVVTNDAKQMNRKHEVKAIAGSGSTGFSTHTSKSGLPDSAWLWRRFVPRFRRCCRNWRLPTDSG
jgi:hypothetical protein